MSLLHGQWLIHVSGQYNGIKVLNSSAYCITSANNLMPAEVATAVDLLNSKRRFEQCDLTNIRTT